MTVLLPLLLYAYCCFDNDREVAVVDDEDDVVVVAVKYEADVEAVATAVAEVIEVVQLFFLERLVLLLE